MRYLFLLFLMVGCEKRCFLSIQEKENNIAVRMSYCKGCRETFAITDSIKEANAKCEAFFKDEE